jgi:hypothetical protein
MGIIVINKWADAKSNPPPKEWDKNSYVLLIITNNEDVYMIGSYEDNDEDIQLEQIKNWILIPFPK